MSAKIVVVGSFNADLVTYMPRLPRVGETVSGHRFITGPGGKGSNQAVAAARLGAEVVFIGRVGADDFASIGFQLWSAEGIRSDYVARDPENATGIASIFVDDGGENMIALALGANMALAPSDIDAATAVIAQADVLIAQLEVPLETTAYALQRARAHGVKTILNPAPISGPIPSDLLVEADYLTPNETELAALVAGGQQMPIAQSAVQLRSRDDQTIIITLGAQGVHWLYGEQSGGMPAFSVNAVDTVGGGDAFNAGLAVALAEGRPLLVAVQFAQAVAALAVTRAGAAAAMPLRAEVERFLSQSGTFLSDNK